MDLIQHFEHLNFASDFFHCKCFLDNFHVTSSSNKPFKFNNLKILQK